MKSQYLKVQENAGIQLNTFRIIFTGGILSILVLCLAIKYSLIPANDHETEFLNTSNYHMLHLIGIALCFPIAAKKIAKFLYRYIFVGKKDESTYLNCFIGILLLSVLIPDVIIYCLLDASSVHSDQVVNNVQVQLSAFKYVILTFCTASLVCLYLPDKFSRQTSVNEICFQAIGLSAATLTFQIFMCICNLSNPVIGSHMVAFVFLMISYIFSVLLFRSCAIELYTSSRRQDINKVISASSLLILLTRNVAEIVIVISSFQSAKSFEYSSYKSASAMMILQVVYYTIVLVVPAQIGSLLQHDRLAGILESQMFLFRFGSDEMRSPLTTMELNMKFMDAQMTSLQSELGTAKIAPIMCAMADLKDACKTASLTIDDMLMAEKIQSGNVAITDQDKESTHIISYLHKMYKQYEIVARHAGVDFQLVVIPEDVVGCSGESWVIPIDKSKISKVFKNLLSNAFKFTPKGGRVVLRVSRSPINERTHNSFLREVLKVFQHNAVRTKEPQTSRSHNQGDLEAGRSCSHETLPPQGHKHTQAAASCDRLLLIEVADNGEGLSSEDLKKFFGQYVQINADVLQEGNGSGLGLWISKGITFSFY